jgi:hypothetical protein
MTKFNWYKALGFGVLVWAVGGAALWVLAATTLSPAWGHGIVAAVIGITAYLFAINAQPEDVGQALGYGAVFVAVGMALDAVITRTFDAHIFTTWQYYLGYALALFAPLFRAELPSDKILSAR